MSNCTVTCEVTIISRLANPELTWPSTGTEKLPTGTFSTGVVR